MIYVLWSASIVDRRREARGHMTPQPPRHLDNQDVLIP